MNAIKYADRELLLSLKRLCTEQNCFRNAKPDEEVYDYYRGTMRLLDEELAKGSTPDVDKAEAIVSNMFIVISNAALYFANKSKDHRKDPITFVTTDLDCSKACRFLDESTKITTCYEAAENKRRHAQQADTPKRRMVVRIVKHTLLILCSIGVLIFLSGLFFSGQPSQPESGNIFTKIVNWYKYELRKEAIPVSFSEKWVQFSIQTGRVTSSVVGIWIVRAITSRVLQVLSRRKNARIRKNWDDYQALCNAFEVASSQMNKLEW